MYKTCEIEGKKYCEVEALEINKNGNNNRTIRFICPFCSVYLKKDGQQRKNPKKYIHTHGMSEYEYEDGYIYGRVPHCIKDKFPRNEYTSFKVQVTENTKMDK